MAEHRPARTARELLRRLKPINDPVVHEMLQTCLPRSRADCQCAACRKRRREEADGE